jgi:hypothetical protein
VDTALAETLDQSTMWLWLIEREKAKRSELEKGDRAMMKQ